MADKGKRIHLTEEEEVFLIGDEIIKEDRSVQSSLTLTGKVLSSRNPNAQALRATLKGAWRTKGDFLFKEISGKLFSFQFKEAADKEKVLNGGPWSFDKSLLVLHEPGLEQSATLSFDKAPFWIRLYNLPLAAVTRKMIDTIGATFGGILEVNEGDLYVCGRFVRMRVMIDLSKPLRRGIMITLGGKKMWVDIKYERLPNLCYVCGKLGHVELECENEEGKNYMNEYGDWLRASPVKILMERSAAEREKERAFLMEIRGEKEKRVMG